MKEYDIIIISTDSATNLVEPLIRRNPRIKIAVIDKDEPGGMSLTGGSILEAKTSRILGAHIIGPEASVLIQEIINVMYASEQSPAVVSAALHIHPSLCEVVQRAFQNPLTVAEYHHLLSHERKVIDRSIRIAA